MDNIEIAAFKYLEKERTQMKLTDPNTNSKKTSFQIKLVLLDLRLEKDGEFPTVEELAARAQCSTDKASRILADKEEAFIEAVLAVQKTILDKEIKRQKEFDEFARTTKKKPLKRPKRLR